MMSTGPSRFPTTSASLAGEVEDDGQGRRGGRSTGGRPQQGWPLEVEGGGDGPDVVRVRKQGGVRVSRVSVLLSADRVRAQGRSPRRVFSTAARRVASSPGQVSMGSVKVIRRWPWGRTKWQPPVSSRRRREVARRIQSSSRPPRSFVGSPSAGGTVDPNGPRQNRQVPDRCEVQAQRNAVLTLVRNRNRAYADGMYVGR